MRRFFSFRSSASGSGSSSNDVNLSRCEKKQGSSQSPKSGIYEPGKSRQDIKASPKSQLRRSLSFSHPSTDCSLGETNLIYVNDESMSQSSYGNSPHHKADTSINCDPVASERCIIMGRVGQDSMRKTHMDEKLDSPTSSRGNQYLSETSPYSSPVALRCRAARLRQISNRNNVLDLYIDGEHQELKSKKDYTNHISDAGSEGYLAEHRALPSSRRPPRAQSTAPPSPTYSKDNLRSYSFRDENLSTRRHSTCDHIGYDHKQMPPQKYVDKPVHAFPGIPLTKYQEYDSEATSVIEDIYEDSSDHPQHNLKLNNVASKYSDITSCNEDMSGCGSCNEELLTLQTQGFFRGNGFMGLKNVNSISSAVHEQATDEELHKKAKEVEDRLVLISNEECELDELQNSSLNIFALLQMIKDITVDRRCLALELSSQIKCRLTDRSSLRGRLKQAKTELNIRTRRLEKEKNEVQLTLERELDRRSNEWSMKFEKFQSEEQRLRERVRELAEQNVSLQREISSLKCNEVENRNSVMTSEIQVNALTASLEEVKAEKNHLHQGLAELQERFNGATEDLNSVKKSYKLKEKENKDLQKLVVQLQRSCMEQDKTITGLRQGYRDEIGKQSLEGSNSVGRLQMEQLRLTAVEQMLRRELESCRRELESLRHENICLLDRLQGAGNSCSSSSVRLEQELCGQLDCLQTQGLSLLKDSIHLCGELLSLIDNKHWKYGEEDNRESGGYSVIEYTLKHQRLKRGTENFTRNLQTTVEILDEKRNLEALECQPQTKEVVASRQLKAQDQLEFDLKAEAILTRLLREKLFSKEQELEQLQADFAASLRSRDILQSEIQKLQDELSCLNHKMRDMELQMLRRDEVNRQLQHDLQECMKELTSTRGVHLKVSEERDHLLEEVKCSRGKIALLEHEVSSLKKKVEALDEDILVKEGQITILRDSLGDKPFNIFCSPKSLKEFALE